MANQTILINGRAYDWASIKVKFLGIQIFGITALNYKVARDKVNNYGAGTEPVSRGYGNRNYESSITLEMNEVRRIQAALAPGQDLTDIPPFPIIVQYMVGSVITTDVIENAEFLEQNVDVSQNDPRIEMELPLIIAGIKFSV